MGKYMRKAKTSGDVAVMDVSQSSSFGVRTRAKTLALQKSQSQSTSGSYLQLRSRRLEKPPVLIPATHYSKRQRQSSKETVAVQNPKSIPTTRASSRLRHGSGASDSNASLSLGRVSSKEDGQRPEEASCKVLVKEEGAQETHENVDVGVEEASFGENVLEFEGRERSTRESTPCSLIRDPDICRTPGSTTRPTCSTEVNRRSETMTRRHIPTAREMDEFFADAEEAQKRRFVEKYNFDPVNDKPLPGRYEWEKLEP
ncbi:cyclin-dependent kinase inhibitor 4 isoform X2 [Neltuma alba]|uniref:cyclin-dependent kinase inhibitor 4 isoform X2 n=1 Tax=Neltuma alba TaxID=207710 RepID=UPI0010A2F8AC|nr:cyclin-dependent kinase inhibitor 4-like isoform X2 [Prosopis alba]